MRLLSYFLSIIGGNNSILRWGYFSAPPRTGSIELIVDRGSRTFIISCTRGARKKNDELGKVPYTLSPFVVVKALPKRGRSSKEQWVTDFAGPFW